MSAPRTPSGHPTWIVATGNALFRVRDALFPIVFLTIAALSSRHLVHAFGDEPWPVIAAGVAIALTGQVLRALVIGLAYIRRGGKDRRIYADTLVQDGFFAHSRNPLYVGNMLVYLGLFVILDSAIGWAAGVPFFLFAYFAITAAEEDYLARRFGADFEAYRRRVPRFLPNWSGIGHTLRGMRFDWKRLVRKEYGSTFIWLTTALALVYWESVRDHGTAASRKVLNVVLAIWMPVLVGYFVARSLKKSGRL